MDKKSLINGLVSLGIGLSLLALGLYIWIILSSLKVPFQVSLTAGKVFSQVLMWFSFACGLILTIAGAIRLSKRRK